MSESKPKSGSVINRDPKSEQRAKGGPGAQEQDWPGHEKDMQPKADHGEESYKGTGKLNGLTALITGGDSGIGRAVAIAFAREGADIAISYFNEHEDARETAKWVEKAGRRVISIAGDVSDHEHCQNTVEKAVKELAKSTSW